MYKKGKDNAVADAASRLNSNEHVTEIEELEVPNIVLMTVGSSVMKM